MDLFEDLTRYPFSNEEVPFLKTEFGNRVETAIQDISTNVTSPRCSNPSGVEKIQWDLVFGDESFGSNLSSEDSVPINVPQPSSGAIIPALPEQTGTRAHQRYSQQQTAALSRCYDSYVQNGWKVPNSVMKSLMHEVRLTSHQVTTWFNNQRSKGKRRTNNPNGNAASNISSPMTAKPRGGSTSRKSTAKPKRPSSGVARLSSSKFSLVQDQPSDLSRSSSSNSGTDFAIVPSSPQIPVPLQQRRGIPINHWCGTVPADEPWLIDPIQLSVSPPSQSGNDLTHRHRFTPNDNSNESEKQEDCQFLYESKKKVPCGGNVEFVPPSPNAGSPTLPSGVPACSLWLALKNFATPTQTVHVNHFSTDGATCSHPPNLYGSDLSAEGGNPYVENLVATYLTDSEHFQLMRNHFDDVNYFPCD
ncbi:hypothetical protein BV898_13663 [Hypsibius exemplaris]|uniref:Homeobox domain-containing protein n=1 Tax=Hypsibius exemplaris TaxID=2072580 RepID=A0A1W0WA74_HYPEX|nr:hypothetical protein BV898_13663 [Hypsibius exemplaris]